MAAYGQNTGFATVFYPTGHPEGAIPSPVGAMLLFFLTPELFSLLLFASALAMVLRTTYSLDSPQ